MSSQNNDISRDIRCTICQETMENATMLIPSGQTYCFECIFQYLQTNPNKDPNLNISYENVDLVPNYIVRGMIDKLKRAIPAQIEENENIIVHARIVDETTSNIRNCKFTFGRS